MSKQQATLSKLRSTLSKQHSTLLAQTATMSNDSIVKCRPFDKVQCCFDIVAVFGNNVAFFGNNVAGLGNNVERNFVLSTKSKQIEHIQFVSTLSKGRNFVRHCRRKRQHCCQKRQLCRSNIRHCRKNRSTCSIRECCWGIFAGVDGASTPPSLVVGRGNSNSPGRLTINLERPSFRVAVHRNGTADR